MRHVSVLFNPVAQVCLICVYPLLKFRYPRIIAECGGKARSLAFFCVALTRGRDDTRLLYKRSSSQCCFELDRQIPFTEYARLSFGCDRIPMEPVLASSAHP